MTGLVSIGCGANGFEDDVIPFYIAFVNDPDSEYEERKYY